LFEELHGIEEGRVLSEMDVDFVVALIMRWVERKL
jgi:hypothetical protein